MKRTCLRSAAAVSCLSALAVLAVQAATRPRRGGTLRVLMAAQPRSLDPRSLPAEQRARAAAEKLVPLMFDRLVSIDEQGRPQPQLATGWQHDAESKRWTFDIRTGVKFWDGSPLTSEIVAAELQSFPGGPPAKASGGAVIVEGQLANPNLLRDLADKQFSIFRAGEDGAILGTGPFYLGEWQPGKRAVLGANQRDWRGQPYPDAIEVEMGVAPRDQLVALELGKADVIEAGPAETRRVAQSGHRVWSSRADELLAIVFQPGRPSAADAKLRQSLALSIDRSAMHAVLLQKQGELAGGLLPQWLSGYAFLFSTAKDLARAQEIASALPPEHRSLTLGYDPNDSLAEAIAQRVAVNAGDAGVAVRAAESNSVSDFGAAPASVDARLCRLPIEDSDAGRALAELVARALVLDWKHPGSPMAPELLYAEERDLLASYQIIPLFHLPHIYGLSGRVKNWHPSPGGEWRLEEVWLEAEKQ